MSIEENKALILRFFKEIDARRDVSVIDEFISPEFIDHSPSPGMPADIEGQRQAFLHFLQATPDGYHAVEDILAEGDKVTVRVRAWGTQTGELFGIPPTGRRMETTGIAIYRIAEGKIVEHWNEVDMLGSMQQLGAIPTPEEPHASQSSEP
jgi:predicted ester cyclase